MRTTANRPRSVIVVVELDILVLIRACKKCNKIEHFSAVCETKSGRENQRSYGSHSVKQVSTERENKVVYKVEDDDNRCCCWSCCWQCNLEEGANLLVHPVILWINTHGKT